MKLGVIGAVGRMGQEIIKLAHQDVYFNKIIGLTKPRTDPNIFEQQFPEVSYYADRTRVIRESDLLIDFSLPEALTDILPMIRKHQTPYVIGTTGLLDHHFQALQDVALRVPVLQSYNMSVGINLLSHFIQQAAEHLGDTFDVAIFDRHHARKQDAPSGTAIMLKKAVEQGQSVNRTVQVASQRIGQVFGEHCVTFASHSEVIELTHTALNRTVFAEGALRAAKWLMHKPPGFYTMQDVFKDISSDVINFDRLKKN